MGVTTIARDFVALRRSGKFEEAGRKYWSPDVVSREPMGNMVEARGIPAVAGKGEWWNANHEVRGFEVNGPYVMGDRFVGRFVMDIKPKAGDRTTMDEIGVCTVADGKIVEESFVYLAA